MEPAKRTSPKLAPATLKQWLDEGRKVTLLDTRNDYEVKLGTFRNAKVLGIDHFRHFPAAVEKLPEEMKEERIVMFCTGGIRCEKAGPFMEMQGYQHIYQLEGGILRYFEDCGNAHYDGECFVFDQRVGVDPALHESGSTQCFACQIPLTREEQQDPRYVVNVSCPHCFKTDEEKKQETIEKRQARIAPLASHLPGSTPYRNERPIHVSARFGGLALLDFLSSVFPHVPREKWAAKCEAGMIVDLNHQPVAAEATVFAGQQLLQLLPETVEPPVNGNFHILYEDEALVVIDKPAPLPMHPGGRFNRNTLDHLLGIVYAPEKLRPAHRLDSSTSGVVVLTRARKYAREVQPQFTRGEVEKVYLALITGHPGTDTFACDLPISSEPGLLGTRGIDEAEGSSARTELTVLKRNDDGTTLIEARPLTGRTNQIRVHLQALGFPIVGDTTYGHATEGTLTPSPEEPPLCLHSSVITFRHPLSREPVTFRALDPSWVKRG